jgi:penicillin-binding protein 2
MNPSTGEILLWVSKPGFDPNLFVSGIPSDIWNGLIGDADSPLLDRVVKASFPPASIFKLVTCATGIEKGIVSSGSYQSVGCTGGITIGNRRFGCWETHGSLDLLEAIYQSCDVYFYQLGMQLGVDEISIQAKKAGFGAKTGIDLPGELKGFIPSEKWYDRRYGKGKWGKGVSVNIAVGQGEILVTPLQILYFVSGIANNGVLCTPTIISKVKSPSGDMVFSNSPSFTNIPWGARTIEILKKGMWGVVNAPTGTGRFAGIPGIEVAGKTGTAQNPTGDTHAWFAAFAPYEGAQICIVVFVEHGGMGGSVAAPIVGQILGKFFHREDMEQTFSITL